MASGAPISQSIVVESVPSAIVGVCKRVLSELEANDFGQEDIFAVHLALEEAFLNSLAHGNKMDANKEIKIDYLVDLDKVEISLTDEGGGFNPESVPDPRSGENLYKSEGRGLFLIRSYMDVVRFNERGNCVQMIRYKEKPPLPKTPNQVEA
jgi:serine/threonine-protein kinase RsbW